MKIKNIAVGDFVQVKKSMCHSEFKAKQVCEVIDIDPTDKYGFDVLIQGKNFLDWVNHKDLKKPIKREPEPQLKQLDQIVFDGLDEKWRFAAVNVSGALILSTHPIEAMSGSWIRKRNLGELTNHGLGYDTTDWQNSIIKRESKPQLKQLDQSVFDGLDSNYMFAAIDGCTGRAYAYEEKPHVPVGKDYWRVHDGMQHPVDYGYDKINWQNSLIERNTAKELTGSELCKSMLARGDRFILCGVSDVDDIDAANPDSIDFRAEAVTDFYCKDELFDTASMRWRYAVPINNQGEPLSAAEAGF